MPRRKKVEEPEIAQVENNPDLVRDMSTTAIINTNNNAFAQRKAQQASVRMQQEIDAKQREDIDALKKDMEEIKAMLTKLVGGK